MSSTHSSKPFVLADGFRGIRRILPQKNTLTATNITNFRILPNGSLEKRPGYAPILPNCGVVRAYLNTRIDTVPYLYLLCENRVYRHCLSTEQTEILGTVTSHDGEAQFFYHGKSLFLLAAKKLYAIGDAEVTPVFGYVPLIGKDWRNDYLGEPNEPMSLLHNQARISYVLSDPPSIFLRVPYPIESVHSVTVNGEVVPPERYKTDYYFNTVNLLEPVAGDRVCVHLSLLDGRDAERKTLLKSDHHVHFGNADRGRLCFWSNSGSDLLFYSKCVDGEQVAESSKFVPESSELYFPAGQEFRVGDSRYAIRGVSRDRDRLLIFTEGETWMISEIESDKEVYPIRGVNSVIGCLSPRGVVTAGNHTVSSSDRTVYRWLDAEGDSYTAQSISKDIDRFLSHAPYDQLSLCYFSAQDELWVSNYGYSEIWICRLETGDWYRYTGMRAEQLIEMNGRMGFATGTGLYVFDETRKTDLKESGVESAFTASLDADLEDMGSERMKTLSHVILHGDSDGATLSLQFTEITPNDPLTVSLSPEKDGTYPIGRIRLPAHRLLRTSIRLIAQGESRPTVRRFGLYTK